MCVCVHVRVRACVCFLPSPVNQGEVISELLTDYSHLFLRKLGYNPDGTKVTHRPGLEECVWVP